MVTWSRISALLVLGVFLLSACGKEDAVDSEPMQSLLSMTAVSQGGIEVKSADLKPLNFGVMVTDHGSTTAYQTYLRNVEAKDGGSASYTDWVFRYDGSSVLFNNLFLVEKVGGLSSAQADVFAYAPFKAGLTPANLASFSYNITEQKDLMWASQNATSANCGIAVDGEVKSVRFDFKHLLCKLQFCFRVKNYAGPDGTHYRLVGLKLTSGTDKLIGTGTFNMLDGTFTRVAYRNEAFERTGTFEKPLVGVPVDGEYSTPVSLLLCPRDYTNADNSYTNGDYTFEFKLYGVNSYLPHATYVMQKADLRYEEGHYGLKPGYVYTFYFTFDNYIHFDGVKTEDWVNEDKEFSI